MPDAPKFRAGQRLSAEDLNTVAGLAAAGANLRAGAGVRIARDARGAVISAVGEGFYGPGRAVVETRTSAVPDVGSAVWYTLRLVGRPNRAPVEVRPERIYRSLANESPAKVIPWNVGDVIPVIVTPGELDGGQAGDAGVSGAEAEVTTSSSPARGRGRGPNAVGVGEGKRAPQELRRAHPLISPLRSATGPFFSR